MVAILPLVGPNETKSRRKPRALPGADSALKDSVDCYGHAATARLPPGGVVCRLVRRCRGLWQFESARRRVGQYETDRGRIRRLSGIEDQRPTLCTTLAN